jgi:hypothetical protein
LAAMDDEVILPLLEVPEDVLVLRVQVCAARMAMAKVADADDPRIEPLERRVPHLVPPLIIPLALSCSGNALMIGLWRYSEVQRYQHAHGDTQALVAAMRRAAAELHDLVAVLWSPTRAKLKAAREKASSALTAALAPTDSAWLDSKRDLFLRVYAHLAAVPLDWLTTDYALVQSAKNQGNATKVRRTAWLLDYAAEGLEHAHDLLLTLPDEAPRGKKQRSGRPPDVALIALYESAPALRDIGAAELARLLISTGVEAGNERRLMLKIADHRIRHRRHVLGLPPTPPILSLPPIPAKL